STVNVLGGEAALDANGEITMGDDIGGTGQSTIDDAIRHTDETANAGWNVTDGTNTNNIGPAGTVAVVGDDNLSVTDSGADDNIKVQVARKENIDQGRDGSVTTGNSVLDNEGLAVDDGAGNTTNVGAGSLSVTDVGGTTTVAGNQVP